MASCSSPPLKKMTLLVVFILLLHQQFISIEASRARGIFPPPTPRPVVNPQASTDGFRINRRKVVETEAFRPTTPGRSPGVGHVDPPGAP
ncbi:hypothetical protein Nepgr_024671 [Nepenthes gracilis]|uniref:Uncharacterized protein n=1 Tax=Nepenthes gracilis TaxID=150966 RepID=A0AAD3XZ09_NEPGR|nr:hypothetical protein Nepgr_024671 [Nepenthes gracilis]